MELYMFSCSFNSTLPQFQGRAVAQAVSRRLPTAVVLSSSPDQVTWDLWWTTWHWDKFSLSTSVSPANSTAPHSSSIIRGWYNRPISGRRTKWTQSHPTPRNQKELTTLIPDLPR
jgi:hypothetical protein